MRQMQIHFALPHDASIRIGNSPFQIPLIEPGTLFHAFGQLQTCFHSHPVVQICPIRRSPYDQPYDLAAPKVPNKTSVMWPSPMQQQHFMLSAEAPIRPVRPIRRPRGDRGFRGERDELEE